MSPVLKRSIIIAGHKTSISLEDEFWNSFKENRRRAGHDRYSVGGEVQAAFRPALWISRFAPLELPRLRRFAVTYLVRAHGRSPRVRPAARSVKT
jgi:Ribbon-helix-helix domain